MGAWKIGLNDAKINPKIYDYDRSAGRRILRFLTPHGLKMAAGVILMATSVFDAIFGPALIGRAVDDGLARGDLRLMGILIIAYLGRRSSAICGRSCTNMYRGCLPGSSRATRSGG
jgi:ABC-type multidrug transport system fused ATPase/permease subunit